MSERKSVLVQKLEARERISIDADVEGFITLGGAELGKVKIWIATIQEQERAAAQAKAHIRETYRNQGDLAEDPDVIQNAKTVFILHAVVRDYRDPKSLSAFPSPKWMMENLTRDEIACLLNLYNVAATQFSPLKYSLSDAELEKIVELSAGTAKVGLPPMHLAPLPEEVLREVVQRVCVKLAGDVRREDDVEGGSGDV